MIIEVRIYRRIHKGRQRIIANVRNGKTADRIIGNPPIPEGAGIDRGRRPHRRQDRIQSPSDGVEQGILAVLRGQRIDHAIHFRADLAEEGFRATNRRIYTLEIGGQVAGEVVVNVVERASADDHGIINAGEFGVNAGHTVGEGGKFGGEGGGDGGGHTADRGEERISVIKGIKQATINIAIP